MVRKYFCVVVLCLCSMLCLTSCGNKDPDIDDGSIDRAVLITTGEDTWEVRVDSETNKLVGYHNGDKTEEFEREFNGEPLISIPIPKETNDLQGQSVITENVYKTTLRESGMYLQYLIEKGYSKDFEALTYKFAEYYFSNETETKRVIVTDSYTVITDVEYKDIPKINLEDYLFD